MATSSVCVLPTPSVQAARQEIERQFKGSALENRLLAGFDCYIAGERVKALGYLFPVRLVHLSRFFEICKTHKINLHLTVA